MVVPLGAFEPHSTSTDLPGSIRTTETFDAIGDGQQGGSVTGEPTPIEVGRVRLPRAPAGIS
jgi:hypothetical protein